MARRLTQAELRAKGKRRPMQFKREAKRGAKPPAYDLDHDGVTQSMLATWSRCRQEMAYVLDGWERPEPKVALVFGSLWHWLLEQSYECVRKLGGVPPFDGTGGLAEQWLEQEGGQIGDMQLAERMLAWAGGLWHGYWAVWKGDLAKEWRSLESIFDVQWEGYRLRGMRDGLFIGAGQKTPVLLETKTRSRVDEEALLLTLPVDFQVLFYITASRAEKVPVKRVLYNVIRKPQLRQGVGESLRVYTERIVGDVARRPEFYFMRYEATYSRKQLEDFWEGLLAKLTAFRAWLEGRGETYKNESACVSRWTCTFLPACSAGGDMLGYTQTRRLFRELDS